jgi:hypothetical protein
MRRLVVTAYAAAALLLTGCGAGTAAPTPPTTTTAPVDEESYLLALHAMGSPAHADPQALDFGRAVCKIKRTGLSDAATLRAVDSWREEDVHLPSGRGLSAHTMAELALGTLCRG